MLEWLKIYTNLGWALFPCSRKTKKPITKHGFLDASLNWTQVEEWYREYPHCAWGVATSADRGVIDIDPRNGGSESLAALIAEHGPIPSTPKVKTGSGGVHYWLRFPPGTRSGKIGEGIDLKAEGGYVIVPPSKIDIPEHQGRDYCWDVPPWDATLAEAPAWIASKPKPKEADAENPWVVRGDDDLLTHPGSPEGERRKTLVRLVGSHLAQKDREAIILAMAEAWASRCQPPFDEWRKHVDGLVVKDGATRDTTYSSSTDMPKVYNDYTDTRSRKEESCNETPFTLPPDAYHGLFGEMLHAVSPETEADPSGVLLGWLTCFGNIVGRGAWAEANDGVLHHPALYIGIVGITGGGKGGCASASLWPFREIEPAWASTCIANGVGSGEGLVERIADVAIDGNGKAVGAADKRCLLRLAEMSGCFKLGRRDGSTLSEKMREAWDGFPIHVVNRKSNALSASDYAVSVCGDITPGMLGKMEASGTEGFDGWMNRFLWAKMRDDTPDLDDERRSIGDVLKPYLERLKSALAFAKTVGRMERDAEAWALWKEVYGALRRSGQSVPHTDRARPQILRISMIYALTDCSKVIRREHLQAALGVWQYCRESAKSLFPKQQTAQPDPLWLQVLNTITASPSIKRGDLTTAFKHKAKADELDGVLTGLEAKGLAYRRTLQGGGRPAECWFPGKPDGDGDGESSQHYNSSFSSSLSSAEDAAGKASKPDLETTEIDKEDFPAFPADGLASSVSPEQEEVVKQNHSRPSYIRIADISPPPNSPLDAEADEALDDDDFLSAFCHKEERGLL
jgi:Bifunctional DNA primase/polymerase, N-terminal/Protein of unknown function (DUF3987)